jgi:hypothetical protein
VLQSLLVKVFALLLLLETFLVTLPVTVQPLILIRGFFTAVLDIDLDWRMLVIMFRQVKIQFKVIVVPKLTLFVILRDLELLLNALLALDEHLIIFRSEEPAIPCLVKIFLPNRRNHWFSVSAHM